MTNFQSIVENIQEYVGKDILITGISENTEVNYDVGMKCKITGFTQTDGEAKADTYLKIELDFLPFEKENMKLMPNDFYDVVGHPVLKWKDSTHYREGKEVLWLSKYEDEAREKYGTTLDGEKNTFELI